MSKLVSLFFILLIVQTIDAKIIKTDKIEEIKQEITSDTLVLFNIAEVLMDTEISLGTQAWRKYVRNRVSATLHDELTLFVFKHIPPKPVEFATAELIRDLQMKGIPVLAFTSRGRHEWYSSQIPNVDLLTERLLRQIGIDFSLSKLPFTISDFSDYYHEGIIYATNGIKKGDILMRFLQITGYTPKKILFVDDKEDSLQSVEEMGIPFVGYAYNHTAKKHADFDPMIAHIQLEALVTEGTILSDEEAKCIKEQQYASIDPDLFFAKVIQKWHDAKK